MLADADWKASVILASMHTLGDQRGTLGCWADGDAVEAHLMMWREVKVLARIGGKSSGEARLLRRVLRYDAENESIFWCSGKRCVQDAGATHQLTRRSHEYKTADTPGTKGTGATLRDGDKMLDGNEDSHTPPRPWHRSCNLRRSR